MAYPPYQHPLLERTGRVTKPWQLFFLSLATGALDGGTLEDGSVTLDKLAPIGSPRLLGRGSDGTGPVEVITIGQGLTMLGTELMVTAADLNGIGYWTPITNGDPDSPELLFDAEGDCVVGFVPTPGGP